MELRKMISCITSITIEKPLEKYGQIYPHPQLVEIRKTRIKLLAFEGTDKWEFISLNLIWD